MSDYGERANELERGIQEVQQKALEAEREGGGEPVAMATFMVLQLGLKNYIDARDRALDEALRLLREDSSSITGKSQQDRWNEYCRGKGQEAFKTIADLVRDEPKHKLFRQHVEILAGQESAFWAQLGQAPIAWFQGAVQEYMREFEKEKQSLQDRWRDLCDRDGSADERAKAVTDEILEIFKNAAKEVATANRSIGERIQEAISTLRQIEDAASPGTPSFLEPIEALLARLNLMKTNSNSLMQRYKDIYCSEETVVILFGETRGAVRTFLENTNLDKAIKQFDEKSRESLELAGKCTTSPQQRDAKRFIEKAIAETKAWLDKFDSAYKQFVAEFLGVFVGPVSDRTVEVLLEKERWDWVKNESEHINIQTELKRIHDGADRTFDVSLDGLGPERRKAVEEIIKKEMDRLSLAVNRATDDTCMDALKFAAAYQRDRLLEKLKAVKAWLE